MIQPLIRFTIRNPLLTFLFVVGAVGWGLHSWNTKTVDAIPDISENQVVVVCRWPGRSPQDVEDQVTYPLSTQLAGVRNVKEIRSLSGFGFSQIYVVFEEQFRLLPSGAVDDFYDARTRVMEKLATAKNQLPQGVEPEIGPDATALGQIFMYTVEGPTDLATLRSVQDFIVRFELQSVAGVAEVASVGGMLRQYQVDVDPDQLRHFGVSITDISAAIRNANVDVGAKTVEAAGVEHILRGVGFIKSIRDIEEVTVGYLSKSGFTPAAGMGMGAGMSMPIGMDADNNAIRGGGAAVGTPTHEARQHRPLTVKDLARVELGPEFRRGALADGKGELVGGIIAMRFGENPRDVIEGVRKSVQHMNNPNSGILPEGVRIVPFYDRTQLIEETTETLEGALTDELLITILVVLLFMLHVRSSLVIAASLPLAVLIGFVFMDLLGIDSNIMSLTGIAIAIGTMVDMGIVMTENIYRHLQERKPEDSVPQVIEEAACEVGPALLTAVATTIVSFIPIFFLTDMEGRLFRPLAWTKSLALMTAALSGIFIVPVLCRFALVNRIKDNTSALAGLVRQVMPWLVGFGLGYYLADTGAFTLGPLPAFLLGALAGGLLTRRLLVEDLSPMEASPVNRAIHRVYRPALTWILEHKLLFAVGPILIILFAILVTVGGRTVLSPVRGVAGDGVDDLRAAHWLEEKFPGLGQEFMPSLDEGSLLYMPSLLPPASLSQALEIMRRQNAAMEAIPEVARVVGKLGRAETALDPAPIAMFETIVVLHPKSMWRDGLLKRDLVNELMRVTHTPGVLEGAGAWIQPIETRVIMLNSGIRAPLAIKLIGVPRDENGASMDARLGMQALENVATRIRDQIASVKGVASPNVENLGGKPYIEFKIDREKVGHYGLTVGDVQSALTTAIGGMVVAKTVEGRERYSIRVAYQRERRNRIDELDQLLVRGRGGAHIPVSQVATIEHVTGPAAIKTEDGLLRLHVTFAASGRDEHGTMLGALEAIETWRAEERAAGRGDPIPPGVSVEAAGRFEAQERARQKFAILIPICAAIIFLLLYLNFRSIIVCLNVFAAVPVCVAGGLILLYAFPAMRDLMYSWGFWDAPSEGPIRITVAVVVGFIALAGIATDDGVVMATYLEQVFDKRRPTTRAAIRGAVIEAGLRRIRPCLMTTFTTIIALYPILASTQRGSDVAQPMALPAVGGMVAGLISLFIVPCVYCAVQEWKLERSLT